MPLKHVLIVLGLVNCPRTKKSWTIAQKIAHKTRKWRVFFMRLKNHIDLVNCNGTPKLWAKAHKNDHKHENEEAFVMPLKHVHFVIFRVNHPGTPKLWAIAHENDHKHKDQVFFACLSNMYILSYFM
jgi:hypothetical protein